jgi:hypothetical protein
MLDSMTRSLCQKVYSGFDGLISPVYNGASDLSSSISGAQSLLSALSGNFSPTSIMNTALNDFRYQSRMYIPGYGQSDIYSMLNFINNCLYYDGKNPYSVLNSLLSQANQGIDNALRTLGSDVPEMNIGSLLGDILNKYLGLNITDVLKQADKILNCLATLCGSEYYVATWKMQSILDDLYIQTNAVQDPLSPLYGTFDFGTLYSNAGLSLPEIGTMTNIMTTYTDLKSEATSSVETAYSTLKGLNLF